MHLTGYVKKYGKFTFKEKPFNDVDALILTMMVYSNLEVVAPSIHDEKSGPTLIKNISSFDYTIVVAGKILIRDNDKLIAAMMESRRFGDIGIKYVDKVFYADLANQFYAATFLVPDVGTYIGIRGTDASICGWKENFELSTKKVVLSQLDTVDYISIISKLEKGPLYVGGHSKGGNLCLYGVIHAPEEVQNRIVKAYSFDGNGLSDDSYYDSPEYLRIKDRFTLYAPYDSIVSELMNNPKERVVVDSIGHGVGQHDGHHWKINKSNGKFVVLKDKSFKAYVRHEAFQRWLAGTTKEEKILITDYVMNALGGVRKTIFDMILSGAGLSTIMQNRKRFTHEQRKELRESLKFLKECMKEAKEDLKKERNSK